jgi:hypothetical protein
MRWFQAVIIVLAASFNQAVVRFVVEVLCRPSLPANIDPTRGLVRFWLRLTDVRSTTQAT